MSETITSCPQCPRHCPIESPGCGRGRAFAQSLKNGGSSVTAPSQMEEYEVSQYGAIVIPPMLTYYNHPQSLEDCTRHCVNRILSQFDLDEGGYQWEGME